MVSMNAISIEVFQVTSTDPSTIQILIHAKTHRERSQSSAALVRRSRTQLRLCLLSPLFRLICRPNTVERPLPSALPLILQPLPMAIHSHLLRHNLPTEVMAVTMAILFILRHRYLLPSQP